MAQGYSVTISAVDQVSAPLANIGKELSQLSRNLKQFQKDSTAPTGSQEKAGFFERAKEFATKGSHEVGKGLREIGHEAREAGRRIGEAFEPIAKLGGLGSGAIGGLGLLGVAEGLSRIAESGQNLLHTSQRIGVSTQAIQGLGNAAKIAGSSSEAMSAGLVSLQEKLTGAALGQDSEAIAFFKQFNVGVRNASDNSIRLADRVLPELADAIAAQKNPTVQAAMAVRAFGEAGILLLPTLRQGREGIERLTKEGEKLDASTGEWVRTADEYKIAQNKVEVAIGGLGKSIATELLPKMKPLTEGFADWLGELQKTPAALKAIEVGIYALGAAAAFATLGGGLKLLRALLPLGVTGAAVGLPLALGGSTPHAGEGLDDYNKQHFVPVPGVVDPRNGKVVRSVAPNGMITYHDNSLGSPAPSSLPPGASGAGEYGVGQPGTRGRPNYNGVTVPIPGKQGAASGGDGGPMQNAQAIAATLKARGWSDAAIRGSLANGLAESGLAAWGAPGAAGERGIWQFNPGSHLPPYERFAAKAGKPVTDVGAQTNYMADWVEGHIPGYKSIQDDRQATDEFMRRFEAPANPVPGSRFGALGRIPNLGTEPVPGGGKPGTLGQFFSRLFGIGSANAAPMPGFGATARFRASQGVELGAINPSLVQIAQAAARGLPKGYNMEVTSGARAGGLPGSRHHGGNALDVQIFGPDGKPISNRGEDTSGLYTQFARRALGAQMKLHPELKGQLGWGGNFETSPGSGVPDLMHLDLGGDRGRFGRLQDLGPLDPDKRSDLDFLRNGDTGDSKTHVQVDFNNAPQGTRTRIASADGPARTSLRTQFAFGAI